MTAALDRARQVAGDDRILGAGEYLRALLVVGLALLDKIDAQDAAKGSDAPPSIPPPGHAAGPVLSAPRRGVRK